MIGRTMTALLAGALLAAPVAAQRPDRAQPPETPAMAQMREMHQHMERLMLSLAETNQWMEQHRAREQFRAMGQQMEQAGERLREMLRQMDRLHQDPELAGDRDRLRDMDRLRDRLRDMTRDLDQAHDALRKMIHKS